ncbi:MAG: hypothetical protein DWQ05_23105 [Calditrichaeota bacterium]|nr:MAG: hypothetical protein DWQ05_23105 [Calditrichota bacterium]
MFRTTNELHDSIDAFHQTLKSIRLNAKNSVEKEKLDLMIAFMEGHKRRLREYLIMIEITPGEKFRNIKIDTISEDEWPLQSVTFRIDPGMSVEEVIDSALKYEDHLIGCYEKIIENCPSLEARDIFIKLLHLTKREKLDFLKYDCGMFYN